MCQTGYCVLLVLLPLCSLREQEAINIVKKCNVAQPPSPFFFPLCSIPTQRLSRALCASHFENMLVRQTH